MRKFLSRIIAAVAGFVYQRGVDLYRLSDWLDPDDETNVTEPEMAAMWFNAEPTVTTTAANGTAKITWINR